MKTTSNRQTQNKRMTIEWILDQPLYQKQSELYKKAYTALMKLSESDLHALIVIIKQKTPTY